MQKFFLLSVIVLSFWGTTFSQEAKYQLSSHILDITQGKPASGVKITLSKQQSNQSWKEIDQKNTDANGRVKNFLKEVSGTNNRGVYKLTFFTEPYFKALQQKSFYPFIEVVFEIKDDSHYHVPITLSPFGYSTYRGN